MFPVSIHWAVSHISDKKCLAPQVVWALSMKTKFGSSSPTQADTFTVSEPRTLDIPNVNFAHKNTRSDNISKPGDVGWDSSYPQ